MFVSPLSFLIGFLLIIASLAALGLGAFWVIGWFAGAAITTTLLVTGIVLLVLSLGGRFLALLLLARPGKDEPNMERSSEFKTITTADGTSLHVEFYGVPDAQPILFTHGIGTNSTDWFYAKKYLSDRYRLIFWDVTGLGKSSRSPNNDYTLRKMASDLEAIVVDLNLAKPVILAGHSMGGMITLTFARYFPQHLGTLVSGLILVNTTYTNPAKTAMGRSFLPAIQKPIIEPLLYLIMGLSPFFWLQSWLSYFNGTTHVTSRFSSFVGRETYGHLDLMSVTMAMSSPGVLARQMLGMLRHDNTEILSRINVPVLVVAASDDRACIPEASQFMQSQIPNAQLVMMEPSGHVSIMEQNRQFTDAVASFVASVAQKSGVKN